MAEIEMIRFISQTDPCHPGAAGGANVSVCLTHYEMLENHIAKLEDENARLRRAMTIIEDRHHPDSEWCDEAKEVL
jgi:hypothetical protein